MITKSGRSSGQILKNYADDFGKHTMPDTTTKVRLIWDAIPSQIARDNNKFIFSHVKQGARAKDLEDALEWIVNAGIAYKAESGIDFGTSAGRNGR